MAVKKCSYVKMSSNIKSIFGLRMRSQIWYLLFAAYFLSVAAAADSEGTCTNVKNIFEKKKMLLSIDLQTQPNSDADQLCLNHGCCGAKSRERLTQLARSQLESALRSELSKLADMLQNKAKQFDDFFKKLLDLSRKEFHTMFKRTYGMIYEQHSYVFQQLFEELERYYTLGDKNFDTMMDNFFGILYEKMFTVLNSQYSFDEKYLKCVNEHMRDIQPFEDVPHKLSVQLRRAVVATRTFHKALRAGSEVVRTMMQVGITPECVTAWARLRFCGLCGGQQAPACTRYCHNVIRGCLPAHADLGEEWDAYIDAVDKVAERLLGPFNIAMVIEPIDIKISEAIMSFQEHNQEISQKIFTGCGKPVLGGGSSGAAGGFFPSDRRRRAIRSIPDFDWSHKANDVDDFEIEASLESLINDDPLLVDFRTPEDIRKATEELAEQAKLRERFLQYMKGHIGLKEYEEHERRRRDADPEPAPGGMDINFKSFEFSEKKGPKKKKPSAKNEETQSAEWGGPALRRLVGDTRARARSSRRYWSHLPALLCASASVPNAPCYNGTAVASYTLPPAGEGAAGLASNPEVRGGGAAGGAAGAGTQRRAAESLHALTSRLKDAFNGVEVQWLDDSDKVNADLQFSAASELETVDDVQGSGSGDHSGGLPDDDEDSEDYDTGSGVSPLDVDTVEDTMTQNAPQPPAPEEPAGPSVVQPPGSSNVQVRARAGDEPAVPVPDVTDTETQRPVPAAPPAGEASTERAAPTPGAAARPSLQRALLAYALPVVCAWFGTVLTDLF